MKKYIICISFIFLLTSCAEQPYISSSAPGFFSGIFHGLIIFFSLIASFFTDVTIYNFPNNGGFYNLGFVLGLMPGMIFVYGAFTGLFSNN